MIFVLGDFLFIEIARKKTAPDGADTQTHTHTDRRTLFTLGKL